MAGKRLSGGTWMSAMADADPATTRRIAISHSDHLLASFPLGEGSQARHKRPHYTSALPNINTLTGEARLTPHWVRAVREARYLRWRRATLRP